MNHGEFAQDGVVVSDQDTGGFKFDKMAQCDNFGEDFIGPTPSGTGTPEPA
jgi:hypothetical protein